MTRILIALTSHGDLGGLRPTGYHVPGAAHPWRVFTDSGCTVDLASTAGGEPPADGVDRTDEVQRAFLDTPAMAARLRSTPALREVDGRAYDAVLFAGGHGTMWDFPTDPGVTAVIRAVWAAGGVVAALCHGPAALIGAAGPDGFPLVAGRTVASFTNSEEEAVGLRDVVPFALQTRLEELGARHSAAPDFTPHVVTDGRLVTGQNPASSARIAKAVLAVLAARGR